MAKRNLLALTFVISLAVGSALCSATYGEKPDSQPKLRIVIYKSYVLALAYYKSDVYKKQIVDLGVQAEQAKTDGKAELLKQAKSKSKSLKQQVQRQLFGRAPIDNILTLMKDALPKIAQDSGVAAISGTVAYHSPDVELLDITDALVGQLNPSDETLEAIKYMTKHHPPVQAK